MHYQRLLAHGDPLIDKTIRRPIGDCSLDDCTSPIRTEGYCAKHYARWLRYGDASIVHLPGSPRKYDICIHDDCLRDATIKERCPRHYNMLRRSLDKKKAYWDVRARRLRKQAVQPVKYTLAQVNLRLSMFANLCWMCGAEADTVDHVKPLRAGGLDCLSNFRPACRSCNSSKKAQWYGVNELHRFIKS
jgi:5-methylcytosine-specific restriction endonuclease McrA